MNSCYLASISATTLVVVLLIGCTGNKEITQNSVPATKNGSTSKGHVASDENGKTNNSIPDDFPSDIHIVDAAKSTELKKSGGKDNLVLTYPERDHDELVKSYLEGMSQLGWAQVTSSKLPIGTITNFTKEDRKCTISIGLPEDKMIVVAIIY